MKFCLFLLISGTLDAALTQIGVETGFVEEGNPLMKIVIEEGWSFFYFIKIILPLLLLGLFYLKPLKGWIRTLLVSTCALYFSVLVYHLVWVLLYLKTST